MELGSALPIGALFLLKVVPEVIDPVMESFQLGCIKLNHARLTIMVYCLPVSLLGVAFLPYIAYFALGFGMFVVGMFLVWWGLVQGQWETTQKEERHSV